MRTPSITPIIRAIIAINVIVFIVQSINPQYDRMIVSLFGLHYFSSEQFNPIQLVTYMFVHSTNGFSHIFFNMLGIYLFAPMLENVWGEKRFLIFYLVTGIGAGLIYMGLKYYDIHSLEVLASNFTQNPDGHNFIKFMTQLYSSAGLPKNQLIGIIGTNDLIIPKDEIAQYISIVDNSLKQIVDSPMIGASGAGFGIKAAFAMLFPNMEFMLFLIPFPVKAKYFVTFLAFYEIYLGTHKMPGDNVAHFAHIGGMIFAFILIKIWGTKRNNFY
jgi:membrane associated rhomboid family serine protease